MKVASTYPVRCRAFDLAQSLGDRWPQLGDPVYFVTSKLCRRWPELSQPDSWLDPTELPGERFLGGENIWIVLTYLRLKAKGLNVRLSSSLVPEHINVCMRPELLAGRMSHRAFKVVAQTDRASLGWGEYTLSQSPALAAARNTCLIDHWPQPRLKSRDPSRGSRIVRIGYVGWIENLAPAFGSDGFDDAMADNGFEFVVRDKPDEWHNYSDLDLALAVRRTTAYWVRTKPSTKLVQSWITGVPAMLGPEPSYRYWGRDGEDYFEITAPEQALAIAKKLRDDPELYESVQRRGLLKSAQHDTEAVCRQWAAALDGPICAAFNAWRGAGKASRALRVARGQVQRRLAPLREKMFYARARGSAGLLSVLPKFRTR